MNRYSAPKDSRLNTAGLVTLKYRICLLIALSLVPSTAWAGMQTGQVTNVLARDDGLHYVFLGGAPTNRAACAAGTAYWMIKDENSTYGKSQFSMLLTAYATGHLVQITGAGTCTRWGDGEDISAIHLLP